MNLSSMENGNSCWNGASWIRPASPVESPAGIIRIRCAAPAPPQRSTCLVHRGNRSLHGRHSWIVRSTATTQQIARRMVRVRFAPGSTRARLKGGPLLTMGPATNHPEQATSAASRASRESPIWTVYILRCTDNSLYVGSSSAPEVRFLRHRAGKGPSYTAKHQPVEIVYKEGFPTRSKAALREAQLKRWSRAKKIALIRGSFDQLRQLSRSHDEW